MRFDESLKQPEKNGQKLILISSKSGKLILVEKDSESISFPDLGTNDRKVLHMLDSDYNSNHYYTFKGLMRKIKLHQQTLARSLHRLESLEFIEKTKAGYQLKQQYKSIPVKTSSEYPDTSRDAGESVRFVQLIQISTPVYVDANQLVSILLGKWFSNLRWLGFIEQNNESILQWYSADNKFQLNLKLLSRNIMLETNASSEKERTEALISSYKILDHISKIMREKLEYKTEIVRHDEATYGMVDST